MTANLPSPDAIEAVALVLHAESCADDECDGSDMGSYEDDARRALTAGYAIDLPRIEAEKDAEIERLRDEVYRLASMQRDANDLARQMADLRDERDSANEAADESRTSKAEVENELSAQVVNLELANEDLEASLDTALAQLTAIAALHYPVDVEPSDTICGGCSTLRGSGESLRYFPTVEWPCPTAAILTDPTAVDAFVRGVKAEAWDEGEAAGRESEFIENGRCCGDCPVNDCVRDRTQETNPYRTDAPTEGVEG